MTSGRPPLTPAPADTRTLVAPPLRRRSRGCLAVLCVLLGSLTLLVIPFLRILAAILIGLGLLGAIHYFVWGRLLTAATKEERDS